MKESYTVSRRINHHASHSGYHELARFVGMPVSIPALMKPVARIGPLHLYFRKKSGMVWYDGLLLEAATYHHMRKHRNAVYHFLFPERDFRFLADRVPIRNHKLIGTFHATPDEFRIVMRQTEHLKRLDVAIAVATNLIPMLEDLFGPGKVSFVPHGVDTTYFSPDRAATTRTRQCICIGHHHRDLDLFCRVAEQIKMQDPEIRIILVDRVFHVYRSCADQEKYLRWFEAIGTIELRREISDSELLDLYRTSAVMLLPLIDATANVALLEALSCGLPIVVNDVGGVRDYLDPTCAALCEADPAMMASHVLQMIHDPTRREIFSRAARSKALTFDWKKIAEQVLDLYEQVRA